ncbi:ABC protein [Trametes versicolor FP-101664 SS1]|uniref:ABC protein n=1 Tax=Trametes versicolor (strain FP-101664) TaxID=717944 RepID=UPI0004621AE5|nr:ABC protein [Trametes versicolor FP-101664 SS1]EIW57395.1 ABC protein [Trametes versicolor FP-101664 SS1]
MADEKLAKVDTNETDVEKGPLDDGSVKKTSAANANARSTRKVEIDTGEELVRFRRHWWQIWLPKDPPPPAPSSLDDASIIPVVFSSIFAILSYTWLNPLMSLGYQRTLQATDLWKMDESREAGVLGDKLDQAWARRVKAANEWNARLAAGDIKPSLYKRAKWSAQALRGSGTYGERRIALEEQWRTIGGKKEPSLAWALNDVFGRDFWFGGAFKVIGDTSQLMGPVLAKAIINFGKEHAAALEAGQTPPQLGRGVGMAIGLFCITVCASVCTHQFFWRSMTTGMFARAALISSIYKRGVSLTGKARTNLSNSALVTHISADVSRIDACAQWFHAVWTAPIQVTICLIILLVQLGPSALAGFSLFLLIIPIQERVMSFQFRVGKKSLKWTDKRAKIILEVLGAMRVVKYFCYEQPFLKRIFEVRHEELKGIKKIQVARSANVAAAYSVPVLAATIAFVTYTSTSHAFDVAIIFSSLSLFQLLRQPLMFLPRALSATTDAQNALARLRKVFDAETADPADAIAVDREQEFAVDVKGATFEWEESGAPPDADARRKKGAKGAEGSVKAAAAPTTMANAPFRVREISIAVPRGTLVAVVGSVGSGKSSLLQGLIGEMRKIEGHVSFGGRVAYCSQTAWIQNATLRENVLFGQPFDEDRYWKVIEDSCLLPDLQVLADGDLTEIGEKGINLSGGQKQRVNIARALYYNADVVIFDDPLSAVDAHVGKALFADAILGALRNQGKTVILVTHALHFLSQCDYVYTLANGRIAEQGTYTELMGHGKEFARLMQEFGGDNKEEEDDAEAAAEEDVTEAAAKRAAPGAVDDAKTKAVAVQKKGAGTGKLEGRLIVREKRTTGSVSWRVYGDYLRAARAFFTGPILVACMFAMQGSQIMNSYTLIWWQANTFDRPNSFYQILYACLGVSQALFTFGVGMAMDEMGFFVSENLHHDSIRNIFYAPMSFFDTTPMGRILSVFGKDMENIDNQLPVSMRLFALTISNVIGSVIIITVVEHYFIIAALGIFLGYSYFASFYRASARELKRIDAMLRSLLYAHFAESLSGLPTIRSYGEVNRFLRDNEYYVDLEDRAAFLTVTNQRWLAIRLDFLGGIMTFIVAILAVSNASGINPAQIGLVLTYTTSLTQLCGLVTRQSAEVENYMSSVERIVEYSREDKIPQEAEHEIVEEKPAPEWPAHGTVEFKEVVMQYRPGLPFVLKGLSLKVDGGEKIGVVGRTGAGKSSLMLALFRIIELTSGSITIDGIDISKIGLRDLRSKISIIPQDPLLFSGTIRSNLDPFNLYTDAQLWDALHRSFLVESSKADEAGVSSDGTHTPTSRFNLDSVIESEGSNLSVGERSLLSLARALVKDSQVVVLDEATASVDLETDAKIQHTIQTQFRHKTLLCIAHRLRTIISYDRILVMDDGKIAEFDTPRNLFNTAGSIFHGMCERSGITQDEIDRSRSRVA